MGSLGAPSTVSSTHSRAEGPSQASRWTVAEDESTLSVPDFGDSIARAAGKRASPFNRLR